MRPELWDLLIIGLTFTAVVLVPVCVIAAIASLVYFLIRRKRP